jgi:hypothetical protein
MSAGCSFVHVHCAGRLMITQFLSRHHRGAWGYLKHFLHFAPKLMSVFVGTKTEYWIQGAKFKILKCGNRATLWCDKLQLRFSEALNMLQRTSDSGQVAIPVGLIRNNLCHFRKYRFLNLCPHIGDLYTAPVLHLRRTFHSTQDIICLCLTHLV